MQQWAKTNPPPKDASKAAFIEAMLTYLMMPKKNWAPELKALSQIVKRTEVAIELCAAMPTELRDHVAFNTEADWRFEVRLADGTAGASERFMVTKELADRLGISYLKASEFGDQEVISMLNQASYNTLIIPRDFPAYKTYKDGQRVLKLWENERDQVKDEVADTLDQFNTTGQIRESWPEMEQYLPAHIADPARVVKLPALTTSRLNERLGIK